ncbi:MAG: hypothetical protein AAGJ93_00560 [Bacteroidota bacterium]
MQNERRSIWIIIGLLLIAGLWRLSLEIEWGMWSYQFNHPDYHWWEVLWIAIKSSIFNSTAFCAIVSAITYGFLHATNKHLTLWLMALQMIILVTVSYYPLGRMIFTLLAWMMIFSVINRSGKEHKREPQEDLLDDF